MSGLAIHGQHGFTEVDSAGIVDPGDAGAIPVDSSGSCALTATDTTETRTLAVPTFQGQVLTLVKTSSVGIINITIGALGLQAYTAIRMSSAHENITLLGVFKGTALAWTVVNNDLAGADNGTSSDLGAGLS